MGGALMDYHPLANIFPLMDGAEFSELVDSIRANGLRDAIVTLDDMILDGRNRERACQVAGVEPRYVQLAAGVDPMDYVIDKNLRRRHLTENQRAMLAARIATRGSGARRGPEPTLQQAAEVFHIGDRSITRARRILRDGGPELHDAVQRNEVSLTQAEKVARLPQEKQAGAIESQREPRKRARRLPRVERVVESQHERDLEFLCSAWKASCPSARAEFQRRLADGSV